MLGPIDDPAIDNRVASFIRSVSRFKAQAVRQ
jgi:hypothetical protein